jgi:hypothetical protein
MDIELFAICDFAQDNKGKLTIVGTFDTYFAKKVPSLIPTCHIAARIRFRAGEHGKIPFSIRIESPDGGDILPPINGSVDLNPRPGSESTAINICVGMGGLPIKVYGKHSITLSVKGQDLRTLPLFTVEPPNPNTQA